MTKQSKEKKRGVTVKDPVTTRILKSSTLSQPRQLLRTSSESQGRTEDDGNTLVFDYIQTVISEFTLSLTTPSFGKGTTEKRDFDSRSPSTILKITLPYPTRTPIVKNGPSIRRSESHHRFYDWM